MLRRRSSTNRYPRLRPGNAKEQAINQKLDCGFAASDKGSKPLADAGTKAEEIKANAH
jgi:hypothetical protein